MSDEELIIQGAAQILLLDEERIAYYKLHKNFREDMCRMILGKASFEQVQRVAKRVGMFAVVDGNRGMGDKLLLDACKRVTL